MNDFMRGFIKGAKETPKGFFAPAIALWRLLMALFKFTDSLMSKNNNDHAKHA